MTIDELVKYIYGNTFLFAAVVALLLPFVVILVGLIINYLGYAIAFLASLFIDPMIVMNMINYLFFPGVMLLGASGLVFMMIILTSAVNMKEGGIPLSMILIILIYLGGEIWDAFTAHDNISHLTHILGGVCGAVFGVLYAKDPKLKEGTNL